MCFKTELIHLHLVQNLICFDDVILRLLTNRNLFIFVVALFSKLGFAQLQGHFDEKINLSDFPYTISNYTTQHGLIQGQITSISRFPNSKTLLFSNYNGLFTFNGYTFDRYTPSKLLENEVFKKLWLDKHNNRIYGYRGDDLFIVYPRLQWTGRYKAVTFQNRQIHAIDSKGTISIDGTVRYKVEGFNKNKIPSQLYFFSNLYLIALENQLLLFDVVKKTNTPILNEQVLSFVKKNLTETYILTKDNVWIFNSEKKSFTKLFLSTLKDVFYNDLIEIKDKILITSNRGLFIYDKINNHLFNFNENNVLPTNILNFISYEPSDECLFIGTGNKGLLKLQLKTATATYKKKEFMANSFASAIGINTKGIYSASGSNVILFDKNKVRKVVRLPISIASLSKIDSSLYAGSWGNGIVKLDLNGKILDHFLKIKTNIHGVYKDYKNEIWIAYTDGVKRGKSLVECRKFAEQQIKMQVVSFYENSKKELLIGGDDGFRILSPDRKKIQIFDKNRVKNIGEIRSFLEDKDGGVWIGSNGGGLFYLKKNILISLNKKRNYLLGNEIFTLALDRYQQVIITSNKGIKIISLKKLHEFVSNQLDFLIPYYIDENKGIYNNEFNGGFQNNFTSLDRVNYFFPTLQGIVNYKSHPMPINSEKIKIKAIFADETQVNTKRMSFDRDTKQITFSFYTTNFVEFQNIHYQYKIIKNGEKKSWSFPQKENDVKLQNIEPGNYLFMVRSIDASNKISPFYLQLNFEIKPYFYETWWFIVLIIVIVSGLFIGLIAYQFHKKRKRLTQILEMNMLVQETEIKAIHSQMNPHFIFNSLHLINHLISTKNYKKAEDLLINFSKLLRNVLEKSDQIFLPLSEELNFIKLYLNIQESRFNNQLKYTINCDPELNQIQIPAMILQPIVENAILHGIAHKIEGVGLISIRAIKEEGKIHIIIQDNGIGRKASKLINVTKSHRSAGYSLIQKKIDLLKIKYNVSVSYTITDINKKNNQTGTIVHLIIDYL